MTVIYKMRKWFALITTPTFKVKLNLWTMSEEEATDLANKLAKANSNTRICLRQKASSDEEHDPSICLREITRGEVTYGKD